MHLNLNAIISLKFPYSSSHFYLLLFSSFYHLSFVEELIVPRIRTVLLLFKPRSFLGYLILEVFKVLLYLIPQDFVTPPRASILQRYLYCACHV